MARCGCGAGEGAVIANGPNTVVTGSGTQANPYMIAAHTDCAEARLCLSGTGGVNYNTGSGVISAKISAQLGNLLGLGTDGGLYVAPGTATVATGPGVLGNGSAGNAVRANVATWSFPGTADSGGSRVYTDSTGALRGEPGYHGYYFESRVTRNYASVAVPTAALVNVDTAFTLAVTNPDAYRTVLMVSVREFDALVDLPASARAAAGFDGAEMFRFTNTGTTASQGTHSYSSKMISLGTLAPGASTVLSMQSQLGSGTNGATYTQISMSHRVMLLPT
jgi:hypothetical protein